MANGQVCGIYHFNGGKNYTSIGVLQGDDGVRQIFYTDGTNMNDVKICKVNKVFGDKLSRDADSILFRSVIGKERRNQFSYSMNDTNNYTDFGSEYTLVPAGYRGDLIGIYTYNNYAWGKLSYDTVPDGEYQYGYIEVEYCDYNY